MPVSPYLTGVSRGLADHEVAAALARQRLTSRLTDRPVAALADCVQVGRAVGLTMSEMQRVTGFARQTLYRHLPSDDTAVRRPSRLQTSIEVLMLLAAEGDFASPSLLARRAGLDPPEVLRVVVELHDEGLCDLTKEDSYSTSVEAAPTAATYDALREHFDELYLRRPDAIMVYIRVPEGQQAAYAVAADAILAKHEHAVIPRSVAPSVMTGPELAFPVNAPTIRRALAITREVWANVLSEMGRGFSEPFVANVIPPASFPPTMTSPVLDAFLEGLIDTGVPNGEALRSLRARFAGGVSEQELAGRCVTTAALALRRAVDNEREPRPIVDGDSAFAELSPARGVPVDREAAPIKAATVAALSLATDRLGPIPGGRLGSFRKQGQPPHSVEGVEPTSGELAEMARLAGSAVGRASAIGRLDAISTLNRILSNAND